MAEEEQLQAYARTSEEAMLKVKKELIRRESLLKFQAFKYLIGWCFVHSLFKISVSKDDTVSLTRFGKIIDIFGPVGNQCLDKVFEIMREPCKLSVGKFSE